ncbi:MAG: Tn3 family transposase [Solirubrobacteraceae bacterium]
MASSTSLPRGPRRQLNALGLIVNTIVLYNTIHTQCAIDHIAAATGSDPRDEDIERLSPPGSDHITLTGRHRILLPAPLRDRSAYRALNTPKTPQQRDRFFRTKPAARRFVWVIRPLLTRPRVPEDSRCEGRSTTRAENRPRVSPLHHSRFHWS